MATESSGAVVAALSRAPAPARESAGVADAGGTGVTASVEHLDPDTLRWAWKALILGLLGMLGASLAGLLWAVLVGSSSSAVNVLVTVFTAMFSGLIGLFAKSPVQR